MSYSRTINGQVHYSGSTTVSYPSSQSGGSKTVYYDGYVPVSIELFVDTSPFDSSVRSCNTSINSLGAAVGVMSASQIASINKGAKEVSDSVTDGFFNMVKSEISQEMAALYSKFNSVAKLMDTHAAALEKQQFVMKNDYDRTSARYNEIFTNLDEELEKRITALDKRAIEISRTIQDEQLHNKVALNLASVLTGFDEEEMVNQQLIIANVNSRVRKTLSDLGQNVVQEMVYAKKMNENIRESACEHSEEFAVPVVYIESEDINQAGAKNQNCYVAQMLESESGRIAEAVKNEFAGQIQAADDAEKNAIEEAFNSFAEKTLMNDDSEKSKRIYKTLMELKNSR